MELSKKAKKDLQRVLVKEIGPKATKKMSDKDLNTIGDLLLTVLAEGLKLKGQPKP